MATAAVNETDVQLRDEVMRQLDLDPEIDASRIGVAAGNGIVALTGYVDSYSARVAAERAARAVEGVRAVANDIEVRLEFERTDTQIATDAAHALRVSGTVPHGVQALVHDSCVTLIGEVDGLFQKIEAEKAMCHVQGVRAVLNHIRIRPRALEHDVRHRIVQALHRSADVDARHVTVAVSGDTALLTGTVSTWLQRDIAERAAAEAPGIRHVDNRLAVEPLYVSIASSADGIS
jgi:osmotically-inducible protein OsmY